MPKDLSAMVDPILDHSPVGGLSEPLYQDIAAKCQPVAWVKSPVGGLSLPEFLRIAGIEE
jgi:hypothetical protein